MGKQKIFFEINCNGDFVLILLMDYFECSENSGIKMDFTVLSGRNVNGDFVGMLVTFKEINKI